MNTLAWVGASVASLWLAVYAFNTLANTALGFAMLAVFFMALLFTYHGAILDVEAMFKKDSEEDEDG